MFVVLLQAGDERGTGQSSSLRMYRAPPGNSLHVSVETEPFIQCSCGKFPRNVETVL